MVTPKKNAKNQDENPRRLIMMSEKHAGEAPWLLGAYDVSQETPFTFSAISQFNCKPNRGGTDKGYFIVNHWLRPDGPPDPVEASKVNSRKVLTQRLQQCITERQQLPNAVAVDFTAQGDLYKTVNQFNAAIAHQSGVTAMVNKAVEQLREREGITDAELRELRGLHRLPKISEEKARALLGPLADRIPAPVDLRTFASPCPPGTHAASDAELAAQAKAEKKAAKEAKRAEKDGVTTTTTTTTTLAPDTGEPTTTTLPPSGTYQDGCVAD
jgi:hypothetical protein